MPSSDRTRWLLMLLQEQLALSITTRDLDDGFMVESERYEDVGGGTLTGSYDRLIDRRQRWVGLRVFPSEGDEGPLIHAIPDLPYIRKEDDGQFADIFFEGSVVDAESAGDQAFGGQFFRTFTGQTAISIDLGYLTQSPKDLEDLRQARAVWFNLNGV